MTDRKTFVLALLLSTAALAQERVGVGFNLYGEGGRQEGQLTIANTSPQPETRDWGGLAFSAEAFVLYSKELKLPPTIRVGPGVRVYGELASLERRYSYGILNDAFVMGEFSTPVFEQFALTIGARAGLSLLIPTGDFAAEIRRLQTQGVGAWSIPRIGWVAGANAGLRRKMTDRFWLRLDLNGQWQTLYLFAIDEVSDGVRYQKYWSVSALRLGLSLYAEATF